MREAVERALAAISPVLRAASVSQIGLDMSGSGWTQTFEVGVWSQPEATQWVQVRVSSAREANRLIDRVVLPAEVETLIRGALAGVPLPEQVMWRVTAQQPDQAMCGALVWPLAARIAALRQKIDALQAQLDALVASEGGGELP